MATLVFTISELIEILQGNDLIPEQISEIEPQGCGVNLKVNTGMVFFKSVLVALEFAGFEDSVLKVEIVPSRFMAKFERTISKYLESQELPSFVSRLEYPHAYIDINKVLAEKAKGVQIQSIAYDHGQFHVTTANTQSPQE